MFCPDCGKKLKKTDLFCPLCGFTPKRPEADLSILEELDELNAQSEAVSQPIGKKKRIARQVIILTVCATLGALTFQFLFPFLTSFSEVEILELTGEIQPTVEFEIQVTERGSHVFNSRVTRFEESGLDLWETLDDERAEKINAFLSAFTSAGLERYDFGSPPDVLINFAFNRLIRDSDFSDFSLATIESLEIDEIIAKFFGRAIIAQSTEILIYENGLYFFDSEISEPPYYFVQTRQFARLYDDVYRAYFSVHQFYTGGALPNLYQRMNAARLANFIYIRQGMADLRILDDFSDIKIIRFWSF